MDKILALIGLCRIKKVRNTTATMHRHYVRCVQNGVKDDFGISPKVNYNPDDWWFSTFDECMCFNSDNVDIVSEPKFID